MKTIKIGIIGCGQIALNKHIPNLLEIPGVEIVAFQDMNEKRAEYAKSQTPFDDAAVLTDYEEMFELEMDAVHVLTPNATHAPISIAFMKAGFHVLTEKPMAIDVSEAEEMVKVSKETGKILSVSLQNRFRKDVKYLKNMVEKDALGHIYHARAHAVRRRAVPSWGIFLDKDAQGGGALIDIGVHALDLTLWLMDNFEPMMVVGKTYDHLGKQDGLFNSLGSWNPEEFKVEDSGFALITMKNGATVFLEASWALNTLETGEAKATLCGTKGGADMKDGLRINQDIDGYLQTIKPQINKEDLEYYDDTLDDENYQEILAWINALKGEEELVVQAEQVLAVTKIIDGIYKSCESGQPVFF